MTKRQKYLDRLLKKPKDFTWDELATVLPGFGYSQVVIGKTGGSRVRFIHKTCPPIIMHKPHPKPVLKTRRFIMKDLIHYKGYYGSVHFDDEDLIFFGKVEFVRALISYEATDARGLRKAFEDAVDDYLHMCLDQKIEAEKPFKGSLNIRLGSDLHRRVAIAAEYRHVTINKFITEVLNRVVSEAR